MVGRKTRRDDRTVSIFLLTAPVLSRGSPHVIPSIGANGALTSVQMIDQSTRPERLKTGADTLKMQTYAKRAEFFALPSVPSFQTPSSLAVSPSPPPLPPALSLAG
jgi:hypothetical protein